MTRLNHENATFSTVSHTWKSLVFYMLCVFLSHCDDEHPDKVFCEEKLGRRSLFPRSIYMGWPQLHLQSPWSTESNRLVSSKSSHLCTFFWSFALGREVTVWG